MANESSKKNNEKLELDQEIQAALKELGIDKNALKRRITPGEVLYLLDQCPFLQIADTRLHLTENLPPLKIIQAQSGWKIHSYGNALSSSPGDLLYGGTEGLGKGTIINQAAMTAFEMVDLAREFGWDAIHLIDGHPLMAWAAWMQTLESGIELEGYTPTAQDHVKWQRIKGYKPSRETLFKPKAS